MDAMARRWHWPYIYCRESHLENSVRLGVVCLGCMPGTTLFRNTMNALFYIDVKMFLVFRIRVTKWSRRTDRSDRSRSTCRSTRILTFCSEVLCRICKTAGPTQEKHVLFILIDDADCLTPTRQRELLRDDAG